MRGPLIWARGPPVKAERSMIRPCVDSTGDNVHRPLNDLHAKHPNCWKMAGVTGLEPATSGVTGQHSNQLSYTPSNRVRLRQRDLTCQADWALEKIKWWAVTGSNRRPTGCKPAALPAELTARTRKGLKDAPHVNLFSRALRSKRNRRQSFDHRRLQSFMNSTVS